MKPKKYVVILECDTGFMECVDICDTANEAYGAAYLALCDGLDTDSYYITLPEEREGECGFVIEIKDKKTEEILHWATVLFYKPEEEAE